MYSPFYSAAIPALVLLLILRVLYWRHKSRLISSLPGPRHNTSWLVGNMPEIMRPKEMGDAAFRWTQEHGTAICIKGPFGGDILFLSDPKALQYIFNIAGYNFPKGALTRAFGQLQAGRGLAWAEGAQHSRQRKIMNSAFSFSALRGFFPIFTHISQKMITKLKQDIPGTGKDSVVVDIFPWLKRATLDAIGAAGFDYQFHAIDQLENNELAQAYDNLGADSFLSLPDWMIMFRGILAIVPEWLGTIMISLPSSRLERLRNCNKVARNIAKQILEKQTALHISNTEATSKDIMSILVRANLAENPGQKMSEDEVLSQLTTIFVAAHDTTSNTLAWAIYELTRHPSYQERVRQEIKATRAQAAQRGDTELTIADLDSMKCLTALIKETLRLYSILPELKRTAGRDDVIPLATPVTTRDGNVITSIPVSRGQQILLATGAYNRLKSVWGPNADQWHPDRFLDGMGTTQNVNFGVFANVGTFGSGVRGCIGWRFAVIEMQVILIELLEAFEFAPPPGNIQIIRGAAGLMSPMVKDSASRRAELPVIITPV